MKGSGKKGKGGRSEGDDRKEKKSCLFSQILTPFPTLADCTQATEGKLQGVT